METACYPFLGNSLLRSARQIGRTPAKDAAGAHLLLLSEMEASQRRQRRGVRPGASQQRTRMRWGPGFCDLPPGPKHSLPAQLVAMALGAQATNGAFQALSHRILGKQLLT